MDELLAESLEFLRRCADDFCLAKITDLRPMLSGWAENKKTLFRLLGGNLKVRRRLDMEMPPQTFQQHLDRIWFPGQELKYCDRPGELDCPYFRERSSFLVDAYMFLWNNYSKVTARQFGRLLAPGNLRTNRLREKVDVYALDLSLQEGSKTMKSIGSVLRAARAGSTLMREFEAFRNKVSDLTTKAKVDQDLILSIDPVDFITMSDNDCGWDTCMAVKRHGSYRAGVLEMLSSPYALVAYLSPGKFNLCGLEVDDKSWRTLVFADERMILNSRSYPYDSLMLSNEVQDLMLSLARDNLGWKYRFEKAPLDEDCGVRVLTHVAYNDVQHALDDGDVLLCSRNDVQAEAVIDVGKGGCRCIVCGHEAVPREDEDFIMMTCEDCRENRQCRLCFHVIQDDALYDMTPVGGESVVCGDCAHSRDMWYWEEMNAARKVGTSFDLGLPTLLNPRLSAEDVDAFFSAGNGKDDFAALEGTIKVPRWVAYELVPDADWYCDDEIAAGECPSWMLDEEELRERLRRRRFTESEIMELKIK